MIGVIIAATAGGLKLRYGGGGAFPQRETGAPLQDASALQRVADLPTPPGNIAVSPAGRIFITLHPEARPDWKVVELVKGAMRPWPSAAFQTGLGEPRAFRDVLSLRIDRQNRLWTLDTGVHGLHQPRLLAFDLDSGKVVHEFAFPRSVAGLGSHLNDFQVSPDGNWIYIADASFFGKNPGLVVYDVGGRRAWRALEGDASVEPDYFIPEVAGRRMELFGLIAIRPGVDSIALDRRGDWLYFAPVTDVNLHRIPSARLRDPALTSAQRAASVEIYAPKTMSDGLSIDDADTIYISDPEHSAIVELRADGSLQTLVRAPQLRWPDGFSFGPDGWLYVTCSSLQNVLGRPPSSIAEHAPYQVFRIRPGGSAAPGH